MRKKHIYLSFLLILAGTILLSGCARGAALNNATSWPGLAAEEDITYTAYGSYVLAISQGEIIWRYPETAERSLYFFASPAITDTELIAGTFNNEVHFIDKISGKLNSKITLPSPKNKIIGTPLITDDHVLITSTDGILHAFDKNGSHSEIWQTKLGTDIWTSPIVLDGKVYLNTLGKQFNIIDLTTGELQKSIATNGAVMSDMVEKDGLIYFGTFGKVVDVFNPKTEEISTLFETDEEIWASPLIIDDKIIVGDMRGNLYCNDIESGKSIWKLDKVGDEGAGIIANPIQLDDETLFIATETGDLLTYDLDGKSISARSTKTKLLTTPVVSGETVITAMIPGETLLKAFTFDLKEDWFYIEKGPDKPTETPKE